MRANGAAALAVVVGAALLVAGAPRALANDVAVCGETLSECTDDSNCRGDETCVTVRGEKAQYSKKTCRAMTAGDGESCGPRVGCAGGKHLCIDSVCRDVSKLRSSTTKFNEDLPKGVFLSRGALSPEEKVHFRNTGANNTVRCKGYSGIAPALEVEDKCGQAITAEVACHQDLLHEAKLRVTFDHGARIGVEVSRNGTGFIVVTKTPIPHMHITCLHGSTDVVELRYGLNHTAWFFYGPLVSPTSDTKHYCEMTYDVPGETSDGKYNPENLVWVTPVTASDDKTWAIHKNKEMPGLQLVLDVGSDTPYLEEVPAFKIDREFIRPRASGCTDKSTYTGFEQDLTLDAISDPDTSTPEELDGDANGILTPLDVDLAIARGTGMGMSVCSASASYTGETTFVVKLVNDNLRCFVAHVYDNGTAELQWCFASDDPEQPGGSEPDPKNLYKIKVESPKTAVSFLVFQSKADPTDQYQISRSGWCHAHRQTLACTAGGEYCAMLSRFCKPLTVAPEESGPDGVSITFSICAAFLVVSLALMATYHGQLDKKHRDAKASEQRKPLIGRAA